MKSKNNWPTSVIENHRVVVLALALTALFLSVFFLLNTSHAVAAPPAMGPECTGCHENTAPAASPLCGTCHGITSFTQLNGAHPTHLNATGGKGPDGLVCDSCHGTNSTDPSYFNNARHRDGVVNFGDASDTLSNTTACNSCHSFGGKFNGLNSTDSGNGMSVGAKDNWKRNEPGSLIYASPSVILPGKDRWCAGCHDDSPPIMGGQEAKKITGDITTGVSPNGFYNAGHGLDASNYYDHDNNDTLGFTSGAGKGCTVCHDAARDHINGVDDSSTIGQRIQSVINGEGVASLQDVCKSCHQVTTGSPATNKVSAHGNATSAVAGFDVAIEPIQFAVECLSCHDPHAAVKNADNSKNLKMIRPNVKINSSTFGDVVFNSRTGANSLDESESNETTQGPNYIPGVVDNRDDLCVTCHSNNQNQGYPTIMHAGALGHENADPPDQRGNPCTLCHNHNGNGDSNYLSADGFKPSMDASGTPCGSCHGAFYNTMKNGSHETHLKLPDDADQRSYRQSLKGPGITQCDVCHPLNPGSHAGHQNGLRDFRDGNNFDNTTVCDSCHSNPAMAKDKWNFPDTSWTIVGLDANEPSQYWGKSGIYEATITAPGNGKETWCVTCHKVNPSVIGAGDYIENTSRTAPNVGGDASLTGSQAYGAFVNGHSATNTAARYDETATNDGGGAVGNLRAGKACNVCHDLTTRHLNTIDGTSVVSDDTSGSTGQRLWGTINNTSTAGTVDGVCKACHQKTAGGAVNQVSAHGNTGENYNKIEAANFEVGCNRCHEGHGKNRNSGGKRNLKMIRAAVKDTADTSISVVYESRIASGSLDSTQNPTKAVCRVCHTSMERNQGGDHTSTVGAFEGNASGADKRGQDCTSCHEHDYKSPDVSNTVVPSNAFMPAFGSASYPSQASCDGACHKTLPTSLNTGKHQAHINGTIARGPGMGSCDTCHGIDAYLGLQTGHYNGLKNLGGSAVTTIGTPGMAACDSCHSPGGAYNGVNDTTYGIGVTKNNNWSQSNSIYQTNNTSLTTGREMWCVSCHDQGASVMKNSNITSGTTQTAIPVGGNGSTYGAYVNGHSATNTAARYDETATGEGSPGGNLKANKLCQTCHDLTKGHISNFNETDTLGQRVSGTINGQSVTSVSGACKACHQYTTGGDKATSQVSSHGNSSGSGENYTQTEGSINPVLECVNCHENHGNNEVTTTPVSRPNLKMVSITVLKSNGNTAAVDYENRLNDKSLDSTQSPGTAVCRVCHVGTLLYSTGGGDHTSTVPGRVFESTNTLVSDKRGQDCMGCHEHNYKGNSTTSTVANAFMPGFVQGGACDGGCHNALPSTMVTRKHDEHLSTAYNRGPRIANCSGCHPTGSDDGTHTSHFDGAKNFGTNDATFGPTTVCTVCHNATGAYNGLNNSTWTIGAKDNWDTTIYSTPTTLATGKEMWCLGCHKEGGSIIKAPATANTSMTAPTVGGNGSTYGAFASGHNATDTSSRYFEDSGTTSGGNIKANKACGVCHQFNLGHLSGQDDTNTTSQSIRGTINGQPVSTVDEACEACHQNGGASNQVSNHGNASGSGENYSPIEGSINPALQCANCHEGHGNNKKTGGKPNLKMMRVAVINSNGATAAVSFESRLNDKSLDSTQSPATSVCRVCHVGTLLYAGGGGDHTNTVAGRIFEGVGAADKRGQDCTSCHEHNYQGPSTTSTVDNAFMPAFVSANYPSQASCDGACHNTMSTSLNTGKHQAHVNSAIARGPGIGSCDTCHGIDAYLGLQPGHVNGLKNLGGSAVTTIGTPGMSACDSCHSPGGAYNGVNDTTYGIGAAKNNNWSQLNSIYQTNNTSLTTGREMWCVGCHDQGASVMKNSNITSGTTQTAIPVGGNGSTYGAYVNGHSATNTAATYLEDSGTPAGGNSRANKLCQTCHDLTKGHISNFNETDTLGQRINGTINSQSGITSATKVCQACHQYETAGAESASAANRVSMHGNETSGGYSPIEGTFAISSCGNCHESHGYNEVTTTPVSRPNLKMVRKDILVSVTTGTTAAIVYFSRSNTDSLDELDSTSPASEADDMCASCHSNANNPYKPMQLHNGGLHNGGGNGADNRGQDCTSCHRHNYGGDAITTVNDGFMPAGCNSCHGNPPVPADVTPVGQEAAESYPNGGGAHVRHVRELGYGCVVCHGPQPPPGMSDPKPLRSKVIISFSTTFTYPQGTNIHDAGTATESPRSTTTTPGRCNVGCHNPKPFKTGSMSTEPVAQGLTNDITWTGSALGSSSSTTQWLNCARCHDSQGKSIDKQKIINETSSTSYTPVSSHGKVDTSLRRDCLICHYIVTPTSATTEHTYNYMLVRYNDSTGTPRLWNANSTDMQYNFCLSCHDVGGTNTNWRFSKSASNTEPVDIASQWSTSTPNTDTSAAAHRTGAMSSKGYGCLGSADATTATGCHGQAHGSAKRKLLAPTNVIDQDEEDLCIGCHNLRKMPLRAAPNTTVTAGMIENSMLYSFDDTPGVYQVSLSGSVATIIGGANPFTSSVQGQWFLFRQDAAVDWIQISNWSANSLTLNGTYGGPTTSGYFYIRATRATHPTGETVGKHDTRAEETTGFNWNTGMMGTRHVECEDCHNVHKSGTALSPRGTSGGTDTIGLINNWATVNNGVWGVTPTYAPGTYNRGGAIFANNSSNVSGASLGGASPNWSSMPGGGNAVGWRIKNNHDKGGRWYTVVGVNGGGTTMTISPAYNGSMTNPEALSPLATAGADYTMGKVTYQKTASPTQQSQLCLKCHSYFAYSANATGTDLPPNTPSGISSDTGVLTDFQTVKQTEVGMDFNPNQLAHHPVMGRGKNQPAPDINANWPDYTSGTVAVSVGSATVTGTNTMWKNMSGGASNRSTIVPGWKIRVPNTGSWLEVKEVVSNTQLKLTTPYTGVGGTSYELNAGLGNTFVYPYGPWSLLGCSDCHRYDGPDNVAGPHGSNNRWMLVEATAALDFSWYSGGTTITTLTPNRVAVGTGTGTTVTKEVFCYNCHRRDVYGDIGLGSNAADGAQTTVADSLLSRIQHNPVSSDSRPFSASTTRWGNDPASTTNTIFCMACHGGESLGGLHGTDSTRSVINEGEAYDSAGITTRGNRPRGERFLNGATWIGTTKPLTATALNCWTKGTADEVNTCTGGHNANKSAGRTANYNY